MATLSSGDTLSLNALAGATGNTQGANVSLSTIKGSAVSTALSSYAIDSVDSISGYTYIVEDSNETYTLTFSGAGSNFSQITGRSDNFTWGITGGSKITLNSGTEDYTALVNVGTMQDTAPQTTLQSAVLHTLSVTFADGYNHHATNYNVARTKPIYSVDTYDGNTVSLCLKSDTLVTLIDGTEMEIGDLIEGDKVKGYSLNNFDSSKNILDWSYEGSLTPEETEVEVINVVYSFVEQIYNINNDEIFATGEHPFVVNSNGVRKYKVVKALEIGDFLIKGDGSEVEITSLEIEEGTVEIVSLDVSGVNTYLANGYITHNKDEGNTHTDLGAPGAPQNLAYTSVDGENKNLTWTAGTSSGTTGITAYDIQVDNNSDFSSPIFDYSEYNSTTLNVVALSPGTHYARVRSIDHGLKSSWATLTFTR